MLQPIVKNHDVSRRLLLNTLYRGDPPSSYVYRMTISSHKDRLVTYGFWSIILRNSMRSPQTPAIST
jgi:hypothetical protein